MSAAALLIPAAALVLGARKLAKGSLEAVDALEFEPRGVKLKFEKFALVVALQLALINRKPTPIFFDSIDAKALYNTSQLGTATQNKRTIVPARGEAVPTITIRLPLGGLLLAIWGAYKAKKLGVITMTGTVKAGALSFDFNEKYDLSKPQKGKVDA